MEQRYLLVCSITTGRQFPEKKNAKLIIEGKFKDELLESDPVPLAGSPQINTELAWELDKKSLHEHKMQRTPIKLNIVAVTNSGRESLGYIVLDLRAVALNTATSGKWTSLLNNRYAKFKSELNIRLSLEEENGNMVNNIAESNPINKGGKLTVEKRELDGKPFLQVGKGGDMYIFALSILEGTDLINLFPSKLSLKQPGFYWFYQLRGNDVIYNPFHDLSKPFPMERASMNVRATKDSLLRFLTSELNYIDIHLCSDDFSLGAALLDYSSQLNRAFHYHNFDNEPLVFHDTFEIKPSGATGGRSGAKVKCAVSVRRDHLPMTPAESPIKPVPSPAASKLPTPKISTEDYDTDHGIDELPPSNGLTTTETHPRVPPVSNHFTFSLEIGPYVNQTLEKARIQFKYTYPFFGSHAPVFSGPPVPVQRKNELVRFGEPFCQFSFACPPDSLTTQFSSSPLVLDLMVSTDEQKKTQVGTAIITLQKCLGFKVIEDQVAVMAGNKLIGALDVKFWVENKGPIHQQIVVGPPTAAVQSQPQLPRHVERPITEPAERDMEETREKQFNAALELEMWKADQEEQFNQQLKQREKATLLKLSEEFAQREQEREGLIARRVAEYEKMEKALKKALQEAKKSEVNVLEHEKELARIRDDLQKEKDRIRQDVRTTIDQQKRELNGVLKVERAKTLAAEERARLYRAELDESEGKYKRLLKELEESKRSLPDPHLQAEIKTLLLDKNELEKRFEQLTKAKAHYKQQWTRAIKELSSAKQREQESAMERVKRQQTELDEMRLKYTIYNEEKIAKTEQDALQTMKNDLRNNTLQNEPPTRESEGKLIIRPKRVTGHAARLRNERDQLLKSGVYIESDRIIQEINQQIKEACLIE